MTEPRSRFNDVVCGVLVRSKRVLLVRRNASRDWAPNCWDAPGGHMEHGESEFEALRRELLEELGIRVAPEAVRLVAHLTGADYDARVFVVDQWSGSPGNRAPEEHDEIAWFGEEQLPGIVMADPDLAGIMLEELRRTASGGLTSVTSRNRSRRRHPR